ncbi:MAG: cysteine--tRNA ligase [Caulobacteraceae bacterium]
MTLRLHNTLTRTKEAFTPSDPKRVTMYVCGPTVYNYAHIGNARPAVVFDVLFRLLRRLYGEAAVVYARNITDVDDKINAKATAEGVPISTITGRYTAIYHADMDALGVLRPTLEPRATEHIPQMLALIGRLVADGKAYAAEGHVLFDTQAYPDSGQLSGRNLDDMIAGARVEVAPYKRHAADFVLWKPSKPGEPEWPSEWGAGRPGWHLECSAMIEENLGPLPIDIHAGGLDLIFPHHENEIAQSCAAPKAKGGDQPEQLARYWLHNGFLTMDAEKMSKSLGNVALVHDLLKQAPGEALRWALLSAHYRAPLDWTDSLIEQSKKSLDGIYQIFRDAAVEFGDWRSLPTSDSPEFKFRDGTPITKIVSEARKFFEDAICNDLNTPMFLSGFSTTGQTLRFLLGQREETAFRLLAEEFLNAASLVGLFQQDPEIWFKGSASDDLAAQVEALLEQRIAARAAKDWPEADRIRSELDALGVVVMDGPTGATWRMRD